MPVDEPGRHIGMPRFCQEAVGRMNRVASTTPGEASLRRFCRPMAQLRVKGQVHSGSFPVRSR